MKVYRYVKKNNIIEQYTNGQTKYYSETVRNAIIKAFDVKSTVRSDERSEQQEKSSFEIISILKKQVERQLEELNIKNNQIAEMQKLLDQQQQLHLQANQRIEHLEKQLTIKPPKDETTNKKDEGAIASYQEKIQELEKQVTEDEKSNAELYEEYERLSKLEKEWKQQETNKKWFQFWKM